MSLWTMACFRVLKKTFFETLMGICIYYKNKTTKDEKKQVNKKAKKKMIRHLVRLPKNPVCQSILTLHFLALVLGINNRYISNGTPKLFILHELQINFTRFPFSVRVKQSRSLIPLWPLHYRLEPCVLPSR